MFFFKPKLLSKTLVVNEDADEDNVEKYWNAREIEIRKILDPFEDEFMHYIKNEISYEFYSYYLYLCHKMNAIFDNSNLCAEINDAKEYGQELPRLSELDVEKLKDVLKQKYDLEIVNENPLQIKKSSN